MYTARLRVIGNDSLKGDKVRLPAQASNVIFSFEDVVFPLTFEIKVPASREAVHYALSKGLPRPKGLSTHCGVREFTAEEGTIEMPSFLMLNLDIQEGKTILIQQVRMEPGTYALFHPTTKFSDFSRVKQTLEMVLRDYTCLTEGTFITLESLAKGMLLKIVETKPKAAVHIVDVDLAIEFTEVLQEEKQTHKEIGLGETVEGRVDEKENGMFILKLEELPKESLLVDLRASVSSASMRNLLKDLTPDVDLYISLKPNPSKTNYKWSSQRFGINQIEIPVGEIPVNEPVLYIAVYGRSASVFSLSVRVNDPLKIGNMLRGVSGASVNESDAPIGKKKCDNCGKFVPDGFMFTRHETHCKRTIWRCEYEECRKRVPVQEKMKHIQLRHAKMKCRNCGEELEGEIAMTHHEQNNCRERFVACPICNLSVKQKELWDHSQACSSRTEQCPSCKQFIPLLQIKAHCLERHNKEWQPVAEPNPDAGIVQRKAVEKSQLSSDVRVSSHPNIDWERKVNIQNERPHAKRKKLRRKWVCGKCDNLNTGIAICWFCKAPRGTKRERQPTAVEEVVDKDQSDEKIFDNHWACFQCNNMNRNTRVVCQFCKRSKRSKIEKSKNQKLLPTDTRETGSIPEMLTQWGCPLCTYINSANAVNCALCGYENKEHKKRLLASRA